MLQIYNSLSGKKQQFVPIHEGEVRLYACGITVYDYSHIGHARGFIFYDSMVRYLRARGYKVTYVRNITDIDDKIIKRANENGETARELADRFIAIMHEDFRALGLAEPDHEPKATDHIDGMVAMIEDLIAKGFAYAADNGDVYYAVEQFAEYGKLSHRSLDDLQAGARVDVNDDKRNPMDFVLWKHSKQGEPSWPSPWGEGRPGWHIECSVMSAKFLGQPFDIHGGGMDLKFPHHENEIAQSEASCGCEFVNIWMHAGLLNINDEKMSKSLNNFFVIRDVLEKFQPEVVRYFMMAAHYCSPINYSEANMQQAKSSLQRLYTALRGVKAEGELADTQYVDAFHKAMDDDFNTPQALAVLFDLAKEINRLRDAGEDASAHAAQLIQLGELLGILQLDPEVFLQEGSDVDAAAIDALVAERLQARADKNWRRADEIRDQLTAMNIVIEDGADGTTWRVG